MSNVLLYSRKSCPVVGGNVARMSNRMTAKGRVMWNKARGNSKGCQTIEAFWTVSQILFYFQNAKESHWVGGGRVLNKENDPV